jgi:hypothetical protein
MPPVCGGRRVVTVRRNRDGNPADLDLSMLGVLSSIVDSSRSM